MRRDLRTGEALAARLRLADGKLYPEKGKVDFIDVAVDPTTDGQMARAVFENADELLTDGQTVRVIVEGNEPAKVMAAPLAMATAIDQTGRYVYVVDGKGVVEQRRITVDFVRDGMIAVASGLKEGDRHRAGPAAGARRHGGRGAGWHGRRRPAEALIPWASPLSSSAVRGSPSSSPRSWSSRACWR